MLSTESNSRVSWGDKVAAGETLRLFTAARRSFKLMRNNKTVETDLHFFRAPQIPR